MSEDLIIDDIEDYEERDNPEELAELKEALIQRCKSANIETEVKNYLDESTYIAVGMPNGREKRWVHYGSLHNIKEILNTEFEKYTFLGDYVAIANYSLNTIEATISSINGMPRSLLYRKLFGETIGGEGGDPIILEENHLGRTVKIEISEVTDIMLILAKAPFSRNGTLSIKISGVNISQHNQSLEILRKLSDSLFFQLDLKDGLALSLVRDRRNTKRPISGRIRRRKQPERVELEFPKIELDEGPSSLYWYGRGAMGMPLLQFLAFYQVIEYYYPTYSQEEVKRRIRSILKDPTFRTDRDGDIGKVLTALSGHGRGFGDERSQLRATINACVDANDLRDFLQENDERIEFFSAKQKGLTNHKLSIKKLRC
tara:strand:- start:3005 stop:4120 length:1116 start_codon:yes stop_codon:yes gene_type:complete